MEPSSKTVGIIQVYIIEDVHGSVSENHDPSRLQHFVGKDGLSFSSTDALAPSKTSTGGRDYEVEDDESNDGYYYAQFRIFHAHRTLQVA